MNSFSSLLTLKNINEDVLKDLQKFVKEELAGLLADEYNLLHEDQDVKDNIHFFGIFAAKPENFRFLPGERFAILELGKYASSIDDVREWNAGTLVAERIFRSKTVQLPIGTFFGKSIIKKAAATSMTSDELQGSLMPKLQKLILMVDPAINFEERKVEMNIEVQKKSGKTLICLFCLDKGAKDKKKYIQFDVPPNSTTGYWNPTNFKRHLQKKHMNANANNPHNDSVEVSKTSTTIASTPKNTVIASTPKNTLIAPKPNNSVIASTPNNTVIAATSKLSRIIRSLEDMIYQQFSEQNLRILQATMTHKIKKYSMKYELNRALHQLKIMRIDKDGSCLFSSISQQLSCCKPNTDDHRELTDNLREKAIEYMGNNLDVVMHAIEGRILEDREAEGNKSTRVTENDCLNFINNELSKIDCWGGVESMQAISIIHKVNILVFNESERFYFPLGFKTKFEKTVMIAYRFAVNSKKN